MDRNTIIGLGLILLMLVGYQLLVPTPDEPVKPTPQQITSRQQRKTQPTIPALLDSTTARAAFGTFATAATGTAQDVVVENSDIKITFSTLGGRVKQVLLKNYKTFDGKPLILADESRTKTALELPTTTGKVDLTKLYFSTQNAGQTLRGGQTARVAFTLSLPNGQSVEQTYTVPGKGFQVGYSLKAKGLTLTQPVRFYWQDEVPRTENDANDNRTKTSVNYYLANAEEFDGLDETSDEADASLDQPARWVSFKQKYFLSGFIAKNTPLQNVKIKQTGHPENLNGNLKTLEVEAQIPAADVLAGKAQFEWFFGPNDFQVVNQVTEGFQRNVYLGYAIVQPINRYVFVPLFNALGKVFNNYGVLITILVLIIKLALTPLTYKSYVSMAKMRVLQPEIANIREKVGDADPAKLQQEQMKLYQQVGVSPLSGCVPQLLTLPILMSVFFLFPNLIELRQESFLWASDLSTYDSVIRFGSVTIPFLGNHISLFTVLMTVSSIGFAYYNNQMTPDQPGSPINMKMLGYIMPLIFFFVMNSFPAGLSWYYFTSNVVTIGQQLLIRRFIDEDKIKAVLEENRKKFARGEVKKSKFSDYLQKSLQAAEEAKKQQDTPSKPRTKKK
ncbi:MAG: membrane protein insertase YidC [Cytophagaceae bacterium]|nr:membrane protein insertase YidC [Cytophagaceae bacterium]